ncbi:N-6 DNA methylase [Agrococcus lahaulensis]|uniref:N-6 DNA methylase n=1 Tax=Agrococcus lahaulensis TaxID=341722 RepID=UPI00047BEB96|nr:N-6 DNA methylase [Agrococcus lahaulensis]
MPIVKRDAPLVKSRKRVADHGEVFTPAWLVEDMLDLVKSETERIDSRFLEPACGSGNFLVPVLERKLAAVSVKHGRSEFEKRHYALFALMCIYGIELLPDNVADCRGNLREVFAAFVGSAPDDEWARAARTVLEANVVQGDALAMTDAAGQPIAFPEWGYLGKGRYQRRDFRYDNLTQRASFQGTLFDALEAHEVFTPVRTYPAVSVKDLAA